MCINWLIAYAIVEDRLMKQHAMHWSLDGKMKKADLNFSIKYVSVTEIGFLPFKCKFFRISITLSIIHKMSYKGVAQPTTQNLCFLLT